MPNVKFRASGRTLTSHAGLSLIGQCLEVAGVDSLDGRFPTPLGMPTSDVIKSDVGLLCLGMSDYDAIENVRRDTPFKQLLSLQKVQRARLMKMHDKRDRQSRSARRFSAITGSGRPISASRVVKKCSLMVIGRVLAPAPLIQGYAKK